MTVQTEGYSTAHDFAHVARVMEYYWINRLKSEYYWYMKVVLFECNWYDETTIIVESNLMSHIYDRFLLSDEPHILSLEVRQAV